MKKKKDRIGFTKEELIFIANSGFMNYNISKLAVHLNRTPEMLRKLFD
jgi:hypothetical protein